MQGFFFMMFDKKSYMCLGEIYREHGVHGFCKFYSYSGTQDNLVCGQRYVLMGPLGACRDVTLLEIMPFQRYYLIHFDIFNFPEDISDYRKATLWIQKDHLKKDKNNVYDFEYEGCELYDKAQNKIGVIQSVVQNPLRQFVVLRDSGQHNKSDKEIFIPVVDHWIIGFDRKNKRLIMDLPEGLCE